MLNELTFIGLGRMGAAMCTRLHESGFTVHGYDENQTVRKHTTAITTYDTLAAAIKAQTASPRVVWLMVPSTVVDTVIATLIPHLTDGDCVIDGGNSFYKDSLRRHHALTEHNLHFVDCGVSGGMDGARHGASLMVGGNNDVVERYTPLFTALATDGGFGHVGGPGAGHFVKMIHNGIEYGMMGALAEGLSTIEKHQAEFSINMPGVLAAYEHGSIISSSLMNWLGDAYRTPGYLEHIAGMVPKGETEFEMEYVATHEDVAVLNAALTQRKKTREVPSRIGTLISAMRNQFGGHKTIKSNGD